MNGNVFDENGLAPTITTNKGEGNKIAIHEVNQEDNNKPKERFLDKHWKHLKTQMQIMEIQLMHLIKE